MKKTIEIFWTGGYDSTFRVVQLSRLPVKIRPIYFSDNRLSEKIELSVIQKVTEILNNKKDTKCEIIPLKIISIEQRIKDDTISEAYQRLLSKTFMGSQYEWLAWFAKYHKGIEISVLGSDGGFIQKNNFLFLLVSDEIIGDYYVLDQEKCDEDVCTVFGNFHYPLMKMSKLGMKKKYLEWDCQEIMNLTWFCHTPINGKPCGLCKPCQCTIEEGMTERFTKMALLRYKLKPVKKILKSLIKKSHLIWIFEKMKVLLPMIS